NKIWLVVAAHILGIDVLCLGIVSRFFCQLQGGVFVDTNIPFHKDLVFVGIVLRVIGVDVGITDMDCDVLTRGSQSVFIIGLTSRSDLYRLILWSFDRGLNASGCKQEKGKQRQRL